MGGNVMLYICSGHNICDNDTCEHKWTHEPSHVVSWRDDCSKSGVYCWSILEIEGSLFEVACTCVPYKRGIIDTFPTADSSYDELVEYFGEACIVERDDLEYDEDEGEEIGYDELPNEEFLAVPDPIVQAHEDRMRMEALMRAQQVVINTDGFRFDDAGQRLYPNIRRWREEGID
jgi:hypothetical protein